MVVSRGLILDKLVRHAQSVGLYTTTMRNGMVMIAEPGDQANEIVVEGDTVVIPAAGVWQFSMSTQPLTRRVARRSAGAAPDVPDGASGA